jgi:hypothetical protein
MRNRGKRCVSYLGVISSPPFHLLEGGRGGGGDCSATDTAARGDGKNMKLKGSCPTPHLSILTLPRRQLTLEIIPLIFSKYNTDLIFTHASGGKMLVAA